MGLWFFDQDDEGFYILAHSNSNKGALKNLTLDDLELLAEMFSDEVTSADEEELYENDEDLVC